MTNASTYVYESLEDYVKLYPKGQDKLTENYLCSLWMNEKTVVFVGNNGEGTASYRPDFSKTIVYFDGGNKEFEKYSKDFEPVLEVKKKGKTIKFIGKEKEINIYVAREFGKSKDGYVFGYILYDDSRPRLNLIMNHITSESS